MWKIVLGGIVSGLSLVAQVQAPPDLQAIAGALDPGECPEVLPVVPPAMVQQSREAVAGVSLDDLEALLRWGDVDAPATLATAIALLDRSDELRRTEAGTLAEIRGCIALSIRADGRTTTHRMFGMTREPDWLDTAGPLARKRARALGARLLRQHPDAAQVGPLLLAFSTAIDGHGRSSLSAEALRRLGATATNRDLLWHAENALHDLDLDAATTALAQAAEAPQPTAVAGRRRAAQLHFDLGQRLAAAKVHAPRAERPGLEGQVAKLRLLQAANPDAAVAESRRLTAAGVEHALPFAILASAAAIAGEQDETRTHLERAAKLPGRDALYIAVLLTAQVLPKLRQGQLPDAARERLQEEVRDTMRRCDAVFADDTSADAAIFRWLREEASWGNNLDSMVQWTAPDEILDSALDLQAKFPDRIETYELVLGTALFATDRVAARKALQRPIPPALAALHDIALQRAVRCLWLDLVEDRPLAAEELEPVLADLERVQGAPHDAAYLRGVRAWWDATRPGAPATASRTAREHLAAAQRPLGERDVWRATVALAVADDALGTDLDVRALNRTRGLDASGRGTGMVPWLCLATMRLGADDPATTDFVQRQLAQVDHGPSLAVLHAQLAQTMSKLGDAEAARRHAKLALQALSTARPPSLPHDRGVLGSGAFSPGLSFKTARHEATVRLEADLWVVPPVPSRDQLRRLAEGK